MQKKTRLCSNTFQVMLTSVMTSKLRSSLVGSGTSRISGSFADYPNSLEPNKHHSKPSSGLFFLKRVFNTFLDKHVLRWRVEYFHLPLLCSKSSPTRMLQTS
uniref:Uncharacterized protein n=1 Tax=Cacopsylla melanoneura TaxID=428564 RepID=A0A8D9B095_9HEMI